MSPRAFLVRGLLIGLLAGVATFVVAYVAGEPHVQAAIELEESGGAASAASPAPGSQHHHDAGTPAHSHDDAAASGATSAEEPGGHSHGEEALVSRHDQRTWGLLTGTLTVGVALGGVVALIAAGAVGRLGRLTVPQSTAAVALVGFVAYGVVPFLKYPATPPAVGRADTIGARTGDYFGFLLVSIVTAVIVVVVAARAWERVGAFWAVVGAAAAYGVVMLVAGQAFPTVNEIGDFPADTLWYFRRASLLTLATLWTVIGVGLVGAVRPLAAEAAERAARRELAASL